MCVPSSRVCPRVCISMCVCASVSVCQSACVCDCVEPKANRKMHGLGTNVNTKPRALTHTHTRDRHATAWPNISASAARRPPCPFALSCARLQLLVCPAWSRTNPIYTIQITHILEPNALQTICWNRPHMHKYKQHTHTYICYTHTYTHTEIYIYMFIYKCIAHVYFATFDGR